MNKWKIRRCKKTSINVIEETKENYLRPFEYAKA
jgi:hypothetical protein